MPPQGQIATWLIARRCTQTGALVQAGAGLATKRFPWNPNVPLEGGARFRPTFKDRYGIAFEDRRSPLEVETLVEAFNTLEALLAQRPDVFGLPPGYRLTEQDKTDLFYVLGPLGGLAIRELVLPEVSRVQGGSQPAEPPPPPPTQPVPPPPPPPTQPVPPPTVPPVPPTPVPPTPTPPPPTRPPQGGEGTPEQRAQQLIAAVEAGFKAAWSGNLRGPVVALVAALIEGRRTS